MKNTKWMIYTRRAAFHDIAARFHISPVLARILTNRGLSEEEIGIFLNGGEEALGDPYRLPDMEKAADVLLSGVRDGKRIRVIGDYDIDGVTSTAILLKGLRRIGAKADFDIPDRIRDGYGLNEALVLKAKEEGADIILTCDNGIAAIAETEKAVSLGLTVVVTDHHEVYRNPDGTERLPAAEAVVDPKRLPEGETFRDICGAVVAWKLVGVLYEKSGISRDEWMALVPLAAVGTVGDVMPLRDENRVIVRLGLAGMPRCGSIGLLKLIERCGLDPAALSAWHIGFVVGPCLNAGGRLESAKTALSLIMTEDESEAERLSAHLKELNSDRKLMTGQGVSEARKEILKNGTPDDVIVVYLKDCHESVAGIIAGRLREEFYRPSLVLTDTSEPDVIKGSGRSIEGYHMFDKLTEVSDLLLKYGGHPMAAGFSLKRSDLEEFRRRLNENAGLDEELLTETVWIDTVLPFSYVSIPFVNELSLLEPTGQGNEKPVFAQRDVRIDSTRVLGQDRNVVRLSLTDESGKRMTGVIFTNGDAFLEEMGERRIFSILYYPSVDNYMGRTSLQAVIKEWKFK